MAELLPWGHCVETFEPGDVIDGKYEILERLGEGGMGFVVSARRRGLASLVALKVLRPQFRDDPELCARFAREAHAADLLRSEYVVRVLDVVISQAGTPFLVMDCLDGQDLAKLLKTGGPLARATAVDYVIQAAEGVDVPADAKRGAVYADLACKAHDAFSCQVIDQIRKNENMSTTMALSGADVETSCNAGNLTNCGILGERLIDGLGMPVDRPRGISLLERSCQGGIARSCQKLTEARR